jgi:hypothetical protein
MNNSSLSLRASIRVTAETYLRPCELERRGGRGGIQLCYTASPYRTSVRIVQFYKKIGFIYDVQNGL